MNAAGALAWWIGCIVLVVGGPWLAKREAERLARRSRMRRLVRTKARLVAARNAGVEVAFLAGLDQLAAAVRDERIGGERRAR